MSKLNEVAKKIVANPKVKTEEIAKDLGISKSYAYTLISQARKKLRMVKVPRVGWVLKTRMQGAQEYREIAVVTTNTPVADKPTPSDNVNHPAHYKVGGIETIDFIEAKKLNYNIGNVVKYLTRAEHKGNTLEDLNKARWYLNREIASLTK
jgi:DNA-binding CsgD family transcriptional regulator